MKRFEKMLENYLYGNKNSYNNGNFMIAKGGYDLYFTIYYNNVTIFENVCNELHCHNIEYLKYIPVILKVFDYINTVKINSRL